MPKGVYTRSPRTPEHCLHLSESGREFYRTHPDHYSPRFTGGHHTEKSKQAIALKLHMLRKGKPSLRKETHQSEETKLKISQAKTALGRN